MQEVKGESGYPQEAELRRNYFHVSKLIVSQELGIEADAQQNEEAPAWNGRQKIWYQNNYYKFKKYLKMLARTRSFEVVIILVYD